MENILRDIWKILLVFGHGCVLQGFDVVLGPEHCAPPFWAGWDTVLVSFLFPPPQVLSQEPSLYSLHTQSTEMGSSEMDK